MAQQGTVKWFSTDRGYGFIAPDNGSEDIFIHRSAVEQASMQTLNMGQRILFDVQTMKGKYSAINIQSA